MPEKLKRCPNGTRRNKKTGKCVPIKKAVNNQKKLTYNNGYKALKYNTVYHNIYKNPANHKYKNISQYIQNKPETYAEGLVDFLKEVEGDVHKNKLLNNKPKPFKIKSKLRSIIKKVTNPNNLGKMEKMSKSIGMNGIKFVEDYCGYQGFVMYKWLMNKYKNIMNERVFTIEVYLTKQGKINYAKMKKCFTNQYEWCFTKGLLDFAKYAHATKIDGKKYYIAPIVLSYSGQNMGHQNALIYDINKNYIYRFEPHGWDTTASSETLDKYLKKRIQESFVKFGIRKEMPEYIPTKTIMPRLGPQAFDISAGGIGRCVIWTQAFLHYRLQYNYLTEKQIFDYIGLQKYNADLNIFKLVIYDVTKFIKRYTQYLKTQKPVMDLYDTRAFKNWMRYQRMPPQYNY